MTEKQYRARLARAKRFDIVRIRWRDSSRVGLGWSSLDDYTDAIDKSRLDLEETSGFFISSNDAYVLVVQSIRQFKAEGLDPHATDGMMIPHEAIRHFEVIAKRADLDQRDRLTSPKLPG